MSLRTVSSLRALTVVTASAGVALLVLAGSAAPAGAVEAGGGESGTHGDRLTFTVAGSQDSAQNGTYTVRCHPAGGSHPAPGRACAALDRATAGGTDPFKPVASRAQCTMVYGGTATAHVTGTWHGREIDARFERTNGCEIDRWEKLVPALPARA